MQLQYMGFDQANDIREYKFNRVAADETATHFVVSADLALFVKYRLGLQEGPALCLKKLSAVGTAQKLIPCDRCGRSPPHLLPGPTVRSPCRHRTPRNTPDMATIQDGHSGHKILSRNLCKDHRSRRQPGASGCTFSRGG